MIPPPFLLPVLILSGTANRCRFLASCLLVRTSTSFSSARTPNFRAMSSNLVCKESLSLKEFLVSQKDVVPNHIVVGNAAGDADSIISALTFAYVESVLGRKSKTVTPIVSIQRKDLETQRPEVSYMFRTLGLESVVDSLRFIDDPIVTSPRGDKKLTLVDHNSAEEVFASSNWEVTEILDHHFDEQQHLETCTGENRQIAFENDKSTAASTCTLVAERLKALTQPKYHSTLASLLLGTILLDSVNMIPQAGKGTPRDASAIKDLLENTDWSTITAEAVSAWWDPSSVSRDCPPSPDSQPDTTRIFESLQAAKFDPNFWKALSVQDALRLDYKRFSATSQSSSVDSVFGASAILLPMKDFLQKPDVAQGIHQYMINASVQMMSILFFYTCKESGENSRQLILCGINGSETGKVVNDMASFLQKDGTLNLSKAGDLGLENERLTVRLFDQNNAKASRKQVAPLMIKFFEQL